MKISKRVGKMALECVGMDWGIAMSQNDSLPEAVYNLGWMSGGQHNRFDGDNSSNAHLDTLMCLIASIAGVKPGDVK